MLFSPIAVVKPSVISSGLDRGGGAPRLISLPITNDGVPNAVIHNPLRKTILPDSSQDNSALDSDDEDSRPYKVRTNRETIAIRTVL